MNIAQTIIAEQGPNIEEWLAAPGDLDDFLFYYQEGIASTKVTSVT